MVIKKIFLSRCGNNFHYFLVSKLIFRIYNLVTPALEQQKAFDLPNWDNFKISFGSSNGVGLDKLTLFNTESDQKMDLVDHENMECLEQTLWFDNPFDGPEHECYYENVKTVKKWSKPSSWTQTCGKSKKFLPEIFNRKNQIFLNTCL